MVWKEIWHTKMRWEMGISLQSCCSWVYKSRIGGWSNNESGPIDFDEITCLLKNTRKKSPLLLHFHQVALTRKRRWLACYGSYLKLVQNTSLLKPLFVLTTARTGNAFGCSPVKILPVNRQRCFRFYLKYCHQPSWFVGKEVRLYICVSLQLIEETEWDERKDGI